MLRSLCMGGTHLFDWSILGHNAKIGSGETRENNAWKGDFYENTGYDGQWI